MVNPLKQTAISWLDDERPRLAASLSFYGLLSLAPLVILTIAVTSLAFGRREAQQALIDEVRDLMLVSLVFSTALSAPGRTRCARGLTSASRRLPYTGSYRATESRAVVKVGRWLNRYAQIRTHEGSRSY